MFKFSVRPKRGIYNENIAGKKIYSNKKESYALYQPASIWVCSPHDILCIAICWVNSVPGKYCSFIRLYLK